MSDRRPITRARSKWTPERSPLVDADAWSRNVSDGILFAMVAAEPAGLHLSISFRDHRGRPSRYPTWDEIAGARYHLLPDDHDFVMHLPPTSEYVAIHDTTFHLHQHPPTDNVHTAGMTGP